MKKKGKYLRFYEECMQTGELPERTINGGFCYQNGLCDALNFEDDNELFELFIPTPIEIHQNNCPSTSYWAADNFDYRDRDFGPTRQNIVLFLAAMNEEL